MLERLQNSRNALGLLFMLPAAAFLLLFVISYLLLYWSIVRFKTPRWLMGRG